MIAAASLALALVIQSPRQIGGRRALGVTVVPAVAGTVGLVAIIALRPATFERFWANLDRLWTVIGLVAAVAGSLILVDYLFTRVLPLLNRRQDRRPSTIEQLALFGTLAALGLAAVAVTATPAIDVEAVGATTTTTMTTGSSTTATTEAGTDPALSLGLTLVAFHEFDGSPLGIAVDRERDLGYMTIGQGRIVMFRPSDAASTDPLELVTVAEGLEYPRGLAIVGDELFVSEIGPLPCDEPFPTCKGEHVDEAMPAQGEVAIVEGSSGRLTAFTIGPDGALLGGRLVLDGLPVAGTDHGVNGLAVGPDGRVYLSVGNFDRLGLAPEVIETLHHPNRTWLGSILRVDPDGAGVEVFAGGLRNVYGLTFASDGSLWAVDNDGPTQSGAWRREEVLQIDEGDDFGFPVDGTFGEPRRRTRGPVWVTDTVGSAGVAWADEVGLGSTLLMGSCGRLQALQVIHREGAWTVDSRTAYVDIMATRGCVTGIATVAPDLILAVTFSGRMYVLRTATSDG
ncbi:MAG: PQQ-dependent sugar dehydrogenase [Acidimicrobiia bacterium]